jgi:hypothetical protein
LVPIAWRRLSSWYQAACQIKGARRGKKDEEKTHPQTVYSVRHQAAEGAFEGKNAFVEANKDYETLGRGAEAEGAVARDRSWASTIETPHWFGTGCRQIEASLNGVLGNDATSLPLRSLTHIATMLLPPRPVVRVSNDEIRLP